MYDMAFIGAGIVAGVLLGGALCYLVLVFTDGEWELPW